MRVEEHAQPVACTGLAKRHQVGAYDAEDEAEPKTEADPGVDSEPKTEDEAEPEPEVDPEIDVVGGPTSENKLDADMTDSLEGDDPWMQQKLSRE